MTVLYLDSALLGRSASVVWNRRDITNRHHSDTSTLDCSNSSFTTRAGALDHDVHGFETVFDCCSSCSFTCALSCECSGLSRAAEAHCTCATLRNYVALWIGHRNKRVVKCCADVSLALWDKLLFAPS